MIEKHIEEYLCEQVKTLGGEVRKAEWTGRRHCPDRRVMHPLLQCWVEVKAPGQRSRPGQLREHERMQLLGEKVYVVSTYDEVDGLLEQIK